MRDDNPHGIQSERHLNIKDPNFAPRCDDMSCYELNDFCLFVGDMIDPSVIFMKDDGRTCGE